MLLQPRLDAMSHLDVLRAVARGRDKDVAIGGALVFCTELK